jgi:hypothetical protein
MTQEKFIKKLDKEGYSYEIKGDKLVVTRGDRNGTVFLNSLLETLPSGVEFKNGGNVYLSSLKTLPPGVEFKNEGGVYLNSLETISPGVEFKNEGSVYLDSLKTLPPGVEFKNEGSVYLESLMGNYVVWFKNWEGNIEGIDSKRLLNLMIKRGLFI